MTVNGKMASKMAKENFSNQKEEFHMKGRGKKMVEMVLELTPQKKKELTQEIGKTMLEKDKVNVFILMVKCT